MNERVIKEAAKRYQEYVLPPYDAMMDMDGFDAICEFSKHFSGTSVYIPKMRSIFGGCLERDMLRVWNGVNMREIVQKYGYSERHVRELIKREK